MTGLERYERERAHDRYAGGVYAEPDMAQLKRAFVDLRYGHRLLLQQLREERQRTARCILASLAGGFIFVGLLWLVA